MAISKDDLQKFINKLAKSRESRQEPKDNPKGAILRILDINLDGSDLPSIDPKSLAMLGYMKLCELTYPALIFTWECTAGDSRDLPNTYYEDESIHSIEHLKTTIYNLEKLRGIPPLPEVWEIARAIDNIERACFYGLRSLQPSKSAWKTRMITLPEDILKLQMEDSCEFLSIMLENNAFILDKLYMNTPFASYLDAKLFGAAIVVYKCFGCTGSDNDYFSIVHNALRRHLNLRAYVERLHAQLILSLSYNPINYNAQMIQDASFVTTWFAKKENLFQAKNKRGFKSTNHIYSFSCCDANPLQLPRGDYIIKRSTHRSRSAFESEIEVHKRLLHRSFIRAVGQGWCMRRYEDEYSAEGLLILPWKKRGSLESNLEGLDWPHAFKLSWQIAYALHLAHTSSLVLCDLKPDNILIDDDGSALMCDFGSVQDAFTDIGQGTNTYNDGSKVASPSLDIYSYGMVLFALLTEHVNPDSVNSLVTILEKIEDGEAIIREKLKKSGCKGQQARSIIKLALDCTKRKESIRPSALDILKRLDAIAELDKTEAALSPADHVHALSQAETSNGTEGRIRCITIQIQML